LKKSSQRLFVGLQISRWSYRDFQMNQLWWENSNTEKTLDQKVSREWSFDSEFRAGYFLGPIPGNKPSTPQKSISERQPQRVTCSTRFFKDSKPFRIRIKLRGQIWGWNLMLTFD
jgi:hypothetical protein